MPSRLACLTLAALLQYTHFYKRADESVKQKTHYVGNNIKSLHISVENSLKKLRTSYIDILYLHWVSTRTSCFIARTDTVHEQWDWTTSIEEVMNALHNLVVAGKVLYLVSVRS